MCLKTDTNLITIHPFDTVSIFHNNMPMYGGNLLMMSQSNIFNRNDGFV